MEFANKEYLLLLLLLIPYVMWYFLYRKKTEPTMRMSDTYAYQYAPKSWKIRLIHLPMLLRAIAFTLVVLALARPQTHNSWGSKTVEGIDIMLSMDVSTSMLAEDLKPNRLEAAKQVATGFISDRPNDNIGLVVFAGESFTQCPLTTDHAVLINLFRSVKFGMIDDGTAIGLGLANAVNRMKDSPTKSKVIILLTDGSNNCGDIDPMTAAEIAHTFGIRVYAIGVGSKGEARIPYQTPIGTQYTTVSGQFDENTLRQIAATTDGQNGVQLFHHINII
jgi:Ca-activated chloride channel family protein